MARVKKEDLRIEKLDIPHLTVCDRHLTPIHIVEAIGHEDKEYSYRGFSITSCGRMIRHSWKVNNIDKSDLICKRCGDFERFNHVSVQHSEYIAGINHQRVIKRAEEGARNDTERAWNEVGERIEQGIMDEAQALIDTNKILVPLTRWEIARLGFLIGRRMVALKKRAGVGKSSDKIDEHEMRDLLQIMEVLETDD